LDELEAQVRHVMTSGTASTRKALLRELVAEIRVEDRHTIRPWFSLPTREPPTHQRRTNNPALTGDNACQRS
jgi:hypothetical protein